MYTQLLAIAVLVVLVWAGIVLARGSLVGTALAVLMAGSCFGYAFFHVDAGRVPLTADRLLLLVLLAQYAIYRHWGQINLVPLLAADYVLGALLAVLSASTLVHDYWALNFRPLATLTFFFLMPGVIYWTVRHGQWTERTAWCVFGTLATFGVYLCFTTVAETQGARHLVFPKYIATGELSDLHAGGRGPFLSSVATGLVQTLGMCAALVLWPRVPWVARVSLLVLLGIFVSGLASTRAPSVWLGGGLALAVLLIGSAAGAWRMRVAGITLAAAAVLVGLGWQQGWYKELVARRAADVAEAPALARLDEARIAWQMFLDRPLLGCGLGQYPREVPAYVDRTAVPKWEEARAAPPQNLFLSLLAETGLLGLGLFLGLLGCWTYTAWRLWRTQWVPDWVRQIALLFLAFTAAYLANGMFHDLSTMPMVSMFLFFLGGAITGLSPWLASRPAERCVWRLQEERELATVF